MRFGTIGAGIVCATAVAATLAVGGPIQEVQDRVVQRPTWLNAGDDWCQPIARAPRASDRLRMYVELSSFVNSQLAPIEKDRALNQAVIERTTAAIAALQKKRESAMSALLLGSVRPFTVATVLRDVVAPLDEQMRSTRSDLYRAQDRVHRAQVISDFISWKLRRAKHCAEDPWVAAEAPEQNVIPGREPPPQFVTLYSRYYFNNGLPLSQATEGSLIEIDLTLGPDGSVSGAVRNPVSSVSLGSMTGRWEKNRAAGKIELRPSLSGGGEGRWELDLSALTVNGIEHSGNWCVNSRASTQITRVFGTFWGPDRNRVKSLIQDRATQQC